LVFSPLIVLLHPQCFILSVATHRFLGFPPFSQNNTIKKTQRLFSIKKNKAASEEKTHMTSTEKLPTKGIYTLIVFLSSEAQLKVGKLGTHTFPAGYYTYTGSALGKGASSLKQRVTRHLKKTKT